MRLEEVREGERFMYEKTRYPHTQKRGPWCLGWHVVREDCLPIIEVGGHRAHIVSGGDFETRSALVLIVEDAKLLVKL